MLVEENNHHISEEVHQALQQNELQYRKNAQIAYYLNLEPVKKMNVFTNEFHDDQNNRIFCCHGERYESEQKQNIFYYIIKTLDEEIPKLQKQYSLAYTYHSFGDFLYFRSILRQMPQSYFQKLKNIYIVDAGLLVKIVQKMSFGALNQFIKSKFIHIDSLQQVVKGKINEKIKMSSLSNVTPKGNSIIKNKLYGRKLEQYRLNSQQIPIVVENLILKLYSTTQLLYSEGIMRKSCNIEKLQVLEGHLMQDQTSINYLQSLDETYTISGCLKKIFHNLENPLFSFEIYDKVIAYQSQSNDQEDIEFVKGCIKMMKQVHKKVLFYLIGFLKKGIVRFKEINKMSSYNLAVVFGPCLFRPQTYSVEDLLNSGKFSKIILLLLQHFQTIVGKEKAQQIYDNLESRSKRFQ